MNTRFVVLMLPTFCVLIVFATPCGAGILVDPGGVIRDMVADPVRNVVYASLDTDEVVALDANSGAVTARLPVANGPGGLAVSPNGSRLYVALLDTYDVAVLNLPGPASGTTYDLSSDSHPPTGLVASPERLYAASDDGLSVVDTADGTEIYFGNPISPYYGFRHSMLSLSSDGETLFALDSGLSPASLYVIDVSQDTPVYIGEDCCHGCLGGNGQDMAVSPDASLVYVTVGGQYHLQVLDATPMLHKEFAGLIGPWPNTVAPSADGSLVYVGYYQEEFAVFRTSDWLPFYVGPLQGRVAHGGLALTSGQATLAAAISYTGHEPDRIELVNVTTLPPNRGGIRLRPLDSVEWVPIHAASIYEPFLEGNSSYVDARNGVLGRAPLHPGSVNFDLRAPSHESQRLNAEVTVGAWTDLGDVVMTRTGDMPNPVEVCVSPPILVGHTLEVEVHGRGFFPGAGLNVTISDPDITLNSFAFTDWATIDATVTVTPGATPGLKYHPVQVTNPDGNFNFTGGHIMVLDPTIFADGFESGNTSRWTSVGH